MSGTKNDNQSNGLKQQNNIQNSVIKYKISKREIKYKYTKDFLTQLDQTGLLHEREQVSDYLYFWKLLQEIRNELQENSL